jgi:hypothetical protein
LVEAVDVDLRDSRARISDRISAEIFFFICGGAHLRKLFRRDPELCVKPDSFARLVLKSIVFYEAVSSVVRGGRFPCPVCAEPREIRLTKNDKPYLICDPCGVQLFIRGRIGGERFAVLLQQATVESVIARFNEMERRYRRRCPGCGQQFWIEPRLIKTSLFDGSLKGLRCPQPDCETTVPWEFES